MKSFSQLFHELPLALPTFSEIRKDNLVYVDKTRYLYHLVLTRQPQLLTRPRRFGKSTLVSTLEELFLHGVAPYDGHDSYFKGLEIEKLWPQVPRNEGPFYVLHLDFSELIRSCHNAADFQQKLNNKIVLFATDAQLELKVTSDIQRDAFDLLLDVVPNGSLVLLVDEYDAPLTRFLGTNTEATSDAMLQVLRDFFVLVKTRASKFRFTFITGTSRLSDASMFTAGNSIADISQDPDFGAICGITRAELQRYFPDHLRYAAAQRLHLPIEQVSAQQVEQLLDEMAQWYDGYCFDSDGATHVFSLWSVLCFFKKRTSTFNTYWFNGGGVPEILRKSLLNRSWEERLGLLAGDSVQVDLDAFLSPSTFATMKDEVLLFQTGYLTLKAPYSDEAEDSEVILGVPNQEIKRAIARMYWVDFFPDITGFSKAFSAELRASIKAQDATSLQQCFNKLFHSIDYEHYPLTQESAVTSVLHIALALVLDVRVMVNLHESQGRADLVFDWDQTTVVFELKYADKLNQTSSLLKQAVAQIQSRNYGDTLFKRPILWRLAMVFCAESRKLTEVQAVSE